VNKACQTSEDERIVVWTMLLEAHATLVDILESELAEVGGLPLTWYDVLVQLEMSEAGRLTMKELSRSVLLSKSGITRLIDRMENAGLIRREACPSDRRVVYARVTPKGKRMFGAAAPVHLRGVHEHFSRHLTADETRAMKSALAKVLQAAEERGHAGDERAAG
jgi:DNA-binding MarR family transcriptional regulator